MRGSRVVLAPLMLSACAPLSGPGSEVDQVRAGMAFRDVVAIVGPAQVFEQTRDDRLVCTAHRYEDARWIHVRYADARVVTASDGHRTAECAA